MPYSSSRGHYFPVILSAPTVPFNSGNKLLTIESINQICTYEEQ